MCIESLSHMLSVEWPVKYYVFLLLQWQMECIWLRYFYSSVQKVASTYGELVENACLSDSK